MEFLVSAAAQSAVVLKLARSAPLYITARQVLVFIAIDKRWPQQVRAAAGASGQKSGGAEISVLRGVFM